MSVNKQVVQNNKIKISNISNGVTNYVPKVIKNYTKSIGNNDNITKNNHQSIKLSSTDNIVIDKNLKCKSYDKDSMDPRKRLKTVHESAQKETNFKNSNIKNVENNNKDFYNNNIQTSIKSTDRIETIQSHPEFNKKINGNKQSTSSGDISGEMIENNNDSDDFGANNNVTETSEQLNKNKLSITEGLKLFGGESISEQFNHFLKCKVIEWITLQMKPVIETMQKIDMWKEKYKSIIREINEVQKEFKEKAENSQFDVNSLPEYILTSDEEFDESLDTNEINTGKKQSTDPSTSKELMISTSRVVSPSTLNPPTITNTDCVDLTGSDEENDVSNKSQPVSDLYFITHPINQSTNPSISKELMISTSKVVSLSTLNQPTITNPDCIGLTGFVEENEVSNKSQPTFKIPAPISNSKALSRKPNSCLTLLPIHHSQPLVNPNQSQPSTSNIMNTFIPYQLPDCQVSQPQLNNELLILVPSGKSLVIKRIPLLPPLLYLTSQHWKEMLLQKPQLFLSKILSSNDIMLLWHYTPDFNPLSFASIVKFQIYMYPGIKNPNEWEFLSEVKAIPMKCAISGIANDNELYVAVRAIDEYGRLGPFSLPLLLLKKYI